MPPSPLPPLSRRTFLRGVGVTMALPFLESLPGVNLAAATTATADGASPFPRRFGVLFMGNGVNPHHWWAHGAGATMELGRSLEPLAALRPKLNVINGLFNREATGQGIHPAMTGNLLSGTPIAKGSIIQGGISMDQMIARHVGQETMQPSIVLACEAPMAGFHETNFSNAYSSHISWRSTDSPVPNELYPALAFDSLFENRGSLRNLSILDRVQDRAAALRRRISSTDGTKLDEYLESVRDVERSIERMRTNMDRAADRAKHTGKPVFTMARPENGLPEDLREHARLMCDIIALGFQTDKTRVASLLLARDLSGLYYPFLNAPDPHHKTSHDDLSDHYERITRFHVEQLAYLAHKLDAMPEGDGTVLDHTCLMWLSNMWRGAKHDNSRVPVLTVGGLGRRLATGRVLDYTDAGDDHRKLCSLYLSLMDRMDVRLDTFGDADARLAGI